MLKRRLIAQLILKNTLVVQSIKFKRFLPVGNPCVAAEFLNNWGIDEIVVLDIDATKENRKPNFGLVKKISEHCFIPLSVGGGIKSIGDIHKLINCGADKVVLNSSVLIHPELVKRASEIFGNQCIIVSIDAKENGNEYKVVSHSSIKVLEENPLRIARKFEELGAGEILLTSIDRDGSKKGYDLDLINLVAKNVKIPTIAAGGAGHPQHFFDLFKETAAAAASAGNFFHFTEHSATIVKSYLKRKNINIRFDSAIHYSDFDFNTQGRIAKMSDEYLEKQRFEIYQPEII